jgi:hypothetical protein
MQEFLILAIYTRNHTHRIRWFGPCSHPQRVVASNRFHHGVR